MTVIFFRFFWAIVWEIVTSVLEFYMLNVKYWRILCDYMHMAFVRVPDGLIWHKSPASGPSRVAIEGQMLVTHARWGNLVREWIYAICIFSHDTTIKCIIFQYFTVFLTWLGNFGNVAASTKMAYYSLTWVLIFLLIGLPKVPMKNIWKKC